MLQLHCTGKDSERQPVTIGDSESHKETLWHWDGQRERASNHRRE